MGAEDAAEQYGGGEGAREKENIGANVLASLNLNEHDWLQSLLSLFGGSSDKLRERAEAKGMDSGLISGMMSMLGGKGSDGGGLELSALKNVVQLLTKGGPSGAGGGVEGFIGLFGGLSGGSDSSNNVLSILTGLGKSFVNTQRNKNPSAQAWGAANPEGTKTSDNSLKNWAMKLVTDLLVPGGKAKETFVSRKNDVDKSTDKDGIKSWYEGHPEVGRMQKDVFDNFFDIGDDDDSPPDGVPLIPAPVGFSEDCSILDEAMVLFLNTNLLLELRKTWRFLYSTKTAQTNFDVLAAAIEYKGPTLLVIRTSSGQIVGAFASTSWCETKGGWIGNGDTFLFSFQPKMAIFYSAGNDENFMFMDKSSGLGFGGHKDRFGLAIDSSLTSGEYHADVDTFDLPAAALPAGSFDIDHLEAWGLGAEPDKADERAKSSVRKPNLQVSGGQVDMNDLLSQIS